MSLKQLQFVLMLSAAATLILTQGCKSSSTEEGKATEQTPVVQEEAKSEVKVEEPAPAVEQPAAPAVVTTPYVIQKGDTISGIAARHNLRWQDVLAVNEKLDPKKLRVGKTIQLPGKVEVKTAPAVKHADKKADKKVSTSGNYTVQNGDSLGLIAKKHGTTVAAIKKSNNLSSDVIRVGQKLNVPGAKAEKKVAKKSEKKADAAAKTETAAPVVTPPPAPVPAVEPAPAVAPAGDATLTPPPATPVDAGAVVAPAVPAAAVPAAPAATQTHTVREGEDLYAIAIRWGVSPTELKNLNGLTSNEVKPGQVLKIPVAAE